MLNNMRVITRAYRSYPNDYRVMYRYMWNIAGDLADNDPAVLIARKDELLSICDKLLAGCSDASLRLGAWNMRAKILHAEGKTEEALQIYRTRFTNWYGTGGQKTEQLFAKDTEEYYHHVRKNMYELADLAADKLGRTVFFDPSLSMAEKTERTLRYADLLLEAFDQTSEDFFLLIAQSFLLRVENDLYYRGGSDEQVIAVMDRGLYATKLLSDRVLDNAPLRQAHSCHGGDASPLQTVLSYHTHATGGRRAELLKNPAYTAVLDRYK